MGTDAGGDKLVVRGGVLELDGQKKQMGLRDVAVIYLQFIQYRPELCSCLLPSFH